MTSLTTSRKISGAGPFRRPGADRARVGTVIVTGGASGLGASVAAIRAAGGQALVLDHESPEPGIPSVRVDVANSWAAEAAVDEIIRRNGGRLDGVVIAAGASSHGSSDEVAAGAWEGVIRANLLGPANVVRAALPYLRSSGGRVVTCASSAGTEVTGNAGAYEAAHLGVVGYTRALATEVSGEVGVTLLVLEAARAPVFGSEAVQHRSPVDARPDRPAPAALVFALDQSADCDLREIVVGA